jgi:hypothetical protein
MAAEPLCALHISEVPGSGLYSTVYGDESEGHHLITLSIII